MKLKPSGNPDPLLHIYVHIYYGVVDLVMFVNNDENYFVCTDHRMVQMPFLYENLGCCVSSVV
jgi:hypothetical protein